MDKRAQEGGRAAFFSKHLFSIYMYIYAFKSTPGIKYISLNNFQAYKGNPSQRPPAAAGLCEPSLKSCLLFGGSGTGYHTVFAQPASLLAPLPLLFLSSLADSAGDLSSPGRPLGTTLKPKGEQGEPKVVEGRARSRRGLAGQQRQPESAPAAAVAQSRPDSAPALGPSPGLPRYPLCFPTP